MTGRPLLAVLLILVSLIAALPAQEEEPDDFNVASEERPSISADRFEQIGEGILRLTGDVDLRYGEIRILADTVNYDDTTQTARAEGNVVLMFGLSQISGDRLEMNLETRLATIWNAHGYMDPDLIFTAAMLERVAEDTVVITDGTVTTCTQPTPYWSFHVSRAKLQRNRYAHMRNVALKAGKASVFWLPYLAWPLKEDRSSGLLLPNVGFSRRRGSFIGNAYYLVLGRSQDVTFYLDLYGKSGTGVGYEYRYVPSPRGQGVFTGYYLNDTVDDPVTPDAEQERARYRFKLAHRQQFAHGYRLLADLNAVSDLDYYLDFERDITKTTSPTVYSQIDVTRNWGPYALNVRADRQEQFITSDEELTLQRLPEMELRGRGLRFGRTPLYLSFVTSASLLNKSQSKSFPNDPNIPFQNPETTYQRYDAFPTISASFAPTPWLDISPSVSARGTFYTRSLAEPSFPSLNLDLLETDDEDIFRGFASYNLNLVGPRFYRLFGEEGKTKYKHTIEPGIDYSYIPEVRGETEDIIRFDEVDTLGGDLHRATYSITSRLFAKRPEKKKEQETGAGEEQETDITGPTLRTGMLVDPKDLHDEVKEALRDQARAPGVGAVEVATFSLTQIYSFDDEQPFMTSIIDTDGSVETLDSPAGPISANIRYNPTASASLDATALFDTFRDDIDTVSFSANLRSLKVGYLRMSYFLDRDLQGSYVDTDGLTVPAGDPNGELSFFNRSSIRVIGGSSFLRRKVTLDLEGSYDIENQDLQDQRYRLGYNTQCCGFLVEVARRDFDTIDEVEYRFTLNLRGVGTLLDLQGRP